MTNKNNHRLRMFDLVQVIDLEPIIISEDNGTSFEFRIEILKECKRRPLFHARVYRRETFRLRPTFPIAKGRKRIAGLSDEELFVLDVGKWTDKKGKTPRAVLEGVLKEIQETFDLGRGLRKRRRSRGSLAR